MSDGAPTPDTITGLVLAGGRGSRMGGADKGLVLWHGKALARHAAERLSPQVGPLAINANRHLDLYESWDLPVWTDAQQDFSGPLAGLDAGLTRCTTDWLVTVPCDSPLFPPNLVARLCEAALAADAPVALAATRTGGRIDMQPVFLLVHKRLRDSVRLALEQGEHRVGRWAAQQGAAQAVFDDVLAFANANTAAELAALPFEPPPLTG